jgi:hypothetical protein
MENISQMSELIFSPFFLNVTNNNFFPFKKCWQYLKNRKRCFFPHFTLLKPLNFQILIFKAISIKKPIFARLKAFSRFSQFIIS